MSVLGKVTPCPLTSSFLAWSSLELLSIKRCPIMSGSLSRPAFSHFLFADDIILAANASLSDAGSIKKTLDLFYRLSGLKVSQSKSKVLFSPNTSDSLRNNITQLLEINSTTNLGHYLGFPLHTSSRNNAFNDLIDKFNSNYVAGKPDSLIWQAEEFLLNLF